MRLPLDLRAPERKRALEREAVALKLPLPPDFNASTPHVGPGCRSLLGDVERALHLPVVREFDDAMLRKLFPPPTTLELRRAIAGVGAWGTRHASQIGYTQSAPDRDEGLSLPPLHLPLDPLDCSKWLQLSYFWAGVPKSHDPMGNGYHASGNTENILRTCRPLHTVEQLELGDPIVWGKLGATHHTAYVIGRVGSSNPLLSSHGREACPCSVLFLDEHRAQEGRVANYLTILG